MIILRPTEDADMSFRLLNLYEERTSNNGVLIEPNIRVSIVDTNLILENTDFLLLMESISNVSINNDPEYIYPVIENWSRKRKIQ